MEMMTEVTLGVFVLPAPMFQSRTQSSHVSLSQTSSFGRRMGSPKPFTVMKYSQDPNPSFVEGGRPFCPYSESTLKGKGITGNSAQFCNSVSPLLELLNSCRPHRLCCCLSIKNLRQQSCWRLKLGLKEKSCLICFPYFRLGNPGAQR